MNNKILKHRNIKNAKGLTIMMKVNQRQEMKYQEIIEKRMRKLHRHAENGEPTVNKELEKVANNNKQKALKRKLH